MNPNKNPRTLSTNRPNICLSISDEMIFLIFFKINKEMRKINGIDINVASMLVICS